MHRKARPKWNLFDGMAARALEMKNRPFLDDELMDPSTPPSFKLDSLMTPRLRRCPFDLDTADWQRSHTLGEGMDGCVWRVHFGGDS